MSQMNAELSAFRDELDALNRKKKDQADALELAEEERKKAEESDKIAKMYENETARREKAVTHSELEKVEKAINSKADAEKTGILISELNDTKANAMKVANKLNKHAQVINEQSQKIGKKADATKVAEKLNEVKKQKAKEFNFIKVDLGSDDDDKKNKKDKK